MSDHIDGPRSMAEPAGDVTDLFAFTSPEDPGRTVLAMCVFPSAGESAMFSNVIDYALAIRPIKIVETGSSTKFESVNAEVRFDFRFNSLEATRDESLLQRGICHLPGGRQIAIEVGDDGGASTPEGDVRVFAGLRSDPFYLAWIAADLKRVPNLLEHDNVLCLVVEFDTTRLLDLTRGSLFGAIGETVPAPRERGAVSHLPPRIDWVGRPEQTNIRLSNPGLSGADDLRDLWNQQRPFELPKELQPLFLKRLEQSLVDWDSRDGKVDWSPEALAANARVFLDDFLLFDVRKPITDQSHLEIEKSTLGGRPYQTGGGRTINANVIDILLTWLVNHDREFLQGGATGATKPGTREFPYLASPNAELQNSTQSVTVAAGAAEVWSLIGEFGSAWNPLIARVRVAGNGQGQLRTLETVDGHELVERLEEVNVEARSYRYTNIMGVPATHYSGTLAVKQIPGSTVVTWNVDYLANGQPDIVVKALVGSMQTAGLEHLRRRFGASA